MNVEQIMTGDVSCCAADASLATAAQMMWEQDCGCVPVCDAEGHVIGMITDRDICMAAWTQGRTLQELRVNAAMARTVVSCRPQDPLAIVESLMQEHQLRRLPVVGRDGRILGIVSLSDIARAGAGEGGLRSVDTEEVARTLAAVSRPRENCVDEWSSSAFVA